jgi:hypothetical protein
VTELFRIKLYCGERLSNAAIATCCVRLLGDAKVKTGASTSLNQLLTTALIAVALICTLLLETMLNRIPRPLSSLRALVFAVAFPLSSYAQSATSLALDVPVSLSGTTSSPSLFSLPASQNLSVSIALCASTSSKLQFFVSNSSTIRNPGPNSGSQDVFQIPLGSGGSGSWSGVVENGAGTLAVYNLASSDSLQVAASEHGTYYVFVLSA